MPVTAFNNPGRVRGAGHPAPLNGASLTDPPARFPTAKTLYVRKTGSDTNGGDTAATAAPITGSDGVTDGSTTFTSASASFDASYVDRLINIVGVGRFRIEAVVGANSLRLSASTIAVIDDQLNPFNPFSANSVEFGKVTLRQGTSQPFWGEGRLLSFVDLRVSKSGTPVDNLVVQIQADDGKGFPSGVTLASATTAGAGLGAGLSTVRFSIAFQLGEGLYHIVLTRSGALSDTDYYQIETKTNLPPSYHLPFATFLNSGVWSVLPVSRLRYLLGFSGAAGLTWNVGGAVQTVGALLGDGNDSVREGDTIYVGAGTYRETVLIRVTPKNGVGPQVSVIGDCDGAKTGDSGMVQLSIFTSGDSSPAPGVTGVLRFSAGASFFAFSKLFLVGASGNVNLGGCVNAGGRAIGIGNDLTEESQWVSFTDCGFSLGTSNLGPCISVTSTRIPINWIIDRCFVTSNGAFLVANCFAPKDGADYDLAIAIRNCAILSPNTITKLLASVGPAGGGKPGGIIVQNNTTIGTDLLQVGTTSASLIFPCLVKNNAAFLLEGATAISGSTLGDTIEDWNFISGGPARSAATNAGANTVTNDICLFHFGQELLWGGLLRSFGEPMAGSPHLGFGGDGSQTAYDVRNGTRPAGAGTALPAAGALERANTFTKETGTVHTGTTAISATGPAYHDFLVAVASGTSYTFSIYVNYDGSYTGTAPQLKLLQGGEAGVADQSVTAGGSAGGGWVQVALSPFSPTSDGFVTVRVQSNDTSGVSEVVFDTFAAS